jgi:hypothetical protein
VKPSVDYKGKYRRGHVRRSVSTKKDAYKSRARSRYYYQTRGKYRRKKGWVGYVLDDSGEGFLLLQTHNTYTAKLAPIKIIRIRSHPESSKEIRINRVDKTYPEFLITNIALVKFFALLKSNITSTNVRMVKNSL